MSLSPEQELVALRRRVVEMEDEVAEWRRKDGQSDLGDGRWLDLKTVLGVQRAPGARVLWALLAASPRGVSYDRCMAAQGIRQTSPDPMAVLKTQVCYLRKDLARLLPDCPPIATIKASAYVLPAETAAEIRRRLAEARP